MASCEVSGLFQHLVPQEALNSVEVQQARQVMIPDFRLELPAAAAPGLATPGLDQDPGQTETLLAELKFSCGKSYYKPGTRQRVFERAVDKRAGELMGDYRQKAERVDRLLEEEEAGRGRLRRRLDQFGQLIGIEVGLFNEGSDDTLQLLDAMASSRVQKVARSTGLTSAQQAAEKGKVQRELRVHLSLSSLRAGMACMLDRCHQIGETAGLCAKRREVAWRVEEEMRRGRQAQHLARVRGFHILRKGHIMM